MATTVASKPSSVRSSAPARSRSEATPTAQRPSPPAKRRWLLRAPRASADSAPGLAPEQRDDPIGLAVVDRAQDDRGRRERRPSGLDLVDRVSSDVSASTTSRRGGAAAVGTDNLRRRGRPQRETFTRLRRAAQQQRQRDRRDEHQDDHEHRQAEPAATTGVVLVDGAAGQARDRRPGSTDLARAASLSRLTARSKRPSGCASRDSDGLGIRSNEAAHEHMRRQTAQRSRFQQLDRRAWNLRRCRNVTDRERFFFSRASEAVSKVLVVHGVGTLQSSSPRRVFFNVFGQLLPKFRPEANRRAARPVNRNILSRILALRQQVPVFNSYTPRASGSQTYLCSCRLSRAGSLIAQHPCDQIFGVQPPMDG